MAMLQRDGALRMWTDHAILAGEKVEPEIHANLESSDLFIALLSPDYLVSNYCYEKEFRHALTLVEIGKIRIVPVILEPCDWLSSPFKEFLALPKDGQPVSVWTNQNIAFLDIVNGLRRLLETIGPASATDQTHQFPSATASRRPRVKQDFDSIQKAEFADKAFEMIQNYFSASCAELSNIDDTLRARFESMEGAAFTCSVVNRAKTRGGEAHITVRNSKQRGFFGDISYIFQRHAEANSSSGAYSVATDDYNLFLSASPMSMMGRAHGAKLSPEQAAIDLWVDFVRQAGIEYD